MINATLERIIYRGFEISLFNCAQEKVYVYHILRKYQRKGYYDIEEKEDCNMGCRSEYGNYASYSKCPIDLGQLKEMVDDYIEELKSMECLKDN